MSRPTPRGIGVSVQGGRVKAEDSPVSPSSCSEIASGRTTDHIPVRNQEPVESVSWLLSLPLSLVAKDLYMALDEDVAGRRVSRERDLSIVSSVWTLPNLFFFTFANNTCIHCSCPLKANTLTDQVTLRPCILHNDNHERLRDPTPRKWDPQFDSL